MNRLQEITKEINDLTLKIEQDYPELYQYLDENPITIPGGNLPEIDEEAYSNYLESLKEMLKGYTNKHKR